MTELINYLIPIDKNICDAIDCMTYDFFKAMHIEKIVDIDKYEKETGNVARIDTIFVTDDSYGRITTASRKNFAKENDKYLEHLRNERLKYQ